MFISVAKVLLKGGAAFFFFFSSIRYLKIHKTICSDTSSTDLYLKTKSNMLDLIIIISRQIFMGKQSKVPSRFEESNFLKKFNLSPEKINLF